LAYRQVIEWPHYLLDAVRSAIRDVRTAGFEATRVEIETGALEDAAPERPSAV
jgi:hypothetical protein